MLDDPDAEVEIWTDYVWADSETEASQKCSVKAQQATVQGRMLVKLVGKPRQIGKGKRYECTFRAEVL